MLADNHLSRYKYLKTKSSCLNVVV